MDRAKEAAAEGILLQLRESVALKRRDWEVKITDLVDDLSKRDDLPLIFSLAGSGKHITQQEARVRVCLRRAYRKHVGHDAKIEDGVMQLKNKNFGRF